MTNGAFLTSELPIAQNVASTDRLLILYNATGTSGTPTTMMITVNNFVNSALSSANVSNANNITSGTFHAAAPIIFYANTYNNLPSPIFGMTTIITDANVTSGDITVGGGPNEILAWYNGTNWRCLAD